MYDVFSRKCALQVGKGKGQLWKSLSIVIDNRNQKSII